MPADILVKLYALPPCPALPDGVVLRRPLPHERSQLRMWIIREFSIGWADEFDTAFRSQPASAWVLQRGGDILGFACYDVTARGFFGPAGVRESEQGQGLGRILLLASMHALRELGYGYAIIGSAGPVDFYLRTLPAMLIPDSHPGIYPQPVDK